MATLSAFCREVYYNEEGEKMSILKEVDDEWIIRRLERWGKKDNMPFLGPQKAGILQDIIRDKQPKLIVEVGGMCGYSALKMSQVLPKGTLSFTLLTLELDARFCGWEPLGTLWLCTLCGAASCLLTFVIVEYQEPVGYFLLHLSQ